MFEKDIAAITATDIENLVVNQVPEDGRLEYKEQYLVQSDSEKKEFLADVSAFANSQGGHIIFGIQEGRNPTTKKSTGLPTSAVGLESFNSDAEILRLEAILREGLSPRLSGVVFRRVDGFKHGPCLVIRVPQSWASPHMITFQSKSPFLSRGNAGKYPMDVGQIRSAFLFSESLSDKIRNFQRDRIAMVTAGTGPVALQGHRKLVVHVIPLSAFRNDGSIDVAIMKKYEQKLAPISSHGFSTRVNLEGLVVYYSDPGERRCFSFSQLHRNGIVELADSIVLGQANQPNVPTVDFEQCTISGVGRVFSYLSEIGITGPAVITAALSGVNRIGLHVHSRHFEFPGERKRQFDRDLVVLPEVLVDDLTKPADIVLKPIFDAAYNAAGWDKCEHYDAEGRWQLPKR